MASEPDGSAKPSRFSKPSATIHSPKPSTRPVVRRWPSRRFSPPSVSRSKAADSTRPTVAAGRRSRPLHRRPPRRAHPAGPIRRVPARAPAPTVTVLRRTAQPPPRRPIRVLRPPHPLRDRHRHPRQATDRSPGRPRNQTLARSQTRARSRRPDGNVTQVGSRSARSCAIGPTGLIAASFGLAVTVCVTRCSSQSVWIVRRSWWEVRCSLPGAVHFSLAVGGSTG